MDETLTMLTRCGVLSLSLSLAVTAIDGGGVTELDVGNKYGKAGVRSQGYVERRPKQSYTEGSFNVAVSDSVAGEWLLGWPRSDSLARKQAGGNSMMLWMTRRRRSDRHRREAAETGQVDCVRVI